jgi:iron complex outermembrane receptor protein
VRAVSLLIPIAFAVGIASAQHVGVPTDDLDKLGVDELFNVQVTSVGREAQELSKAPAAVFVLSAEDIRRSGATCIREALQWVPGLTVLRLDSRSWVVSARGGAKLYANKMLVMIDGRSLYTPLFGGVIWDAVDVDLEDVEQIEVVRGPGAVMWGPNAVNGVINIITKRAQATKAGTASAATGNELRGETEVRWGGAPSDRFAYRVWGKLEESTPAYGSPGYFYLGEGYMYRDPSVNDLNAASGRLGFRFDGSPTEKDRWTVQGDLYEMGRHDTLAYAVLVPVTTDLENGHTGYTGGYIQGSWTRTASASTESALNFSFDRDNTGYPYIAGTENNMTVDFQQRWKTGAGNEVYWGTGYQQYWDDTSSLRFAAFDPASYTFRMSDAVVRDQWQVVPDRLMVSAGVRLDYSSYRHLEYQPSFRLLYTPSSKQSVWFAASRAVDLPSRFDRDLRVQAGEIVENGMPITLLGYGSESLSSETERSLEVGYRLQSGQRWSVDASIFWSYYGRLYADQMPLLPVVTFNGRIPSLSMPMVADNAGAGRSYGGEIWGMWQVRTGWRLIPSYSYLNEATWLPAASANVGYAWNMQPLTVPHQALLRSQHDLSRTLKFDLMAKARSRDENYALPGAFLLGARLAWRPTRSGELSFSVDNLTNRRVLEAYAERPNIAIPIRRTYMLRWTQRF